MTVDELVKALQAIPLESRGLPVVIFDGDTYYEVTLVNQNRIDPYYKTRNRDVIEIA